MSVGFGFSIGDILAVIKLVGNVIDGLRESSRATARFRSLINELHLLETALISVKRLDADINHVHKIALEQAASQCQRTIDEFYKKIQKYQPHLQQIGTASRIKDAWFKIIWTTCKQDDLNTFRAEIRGHTSSIEILLLTVHMETTSTQNRRQDIQHNSLAVSIQGFSFKVMNKLSDITNALAKTAQQGKALLESSNQIIQTNLRIFAIVHDIHALVLTIPGQIQRQQPIYLLDPINRETPFHLEFVRSKEALLAVLKINLKDTGCGPTMIDRNEFVIEDRATKAPINLRSSWDVCFSPGQKVAMSMVFVKQLETTGSSCPTCNTEQQGLIGKEITCTNCGIVFRHLGVDPYNLIDDPEVADTSWASPGTLSTKPMALPSRKRRSEDDDTGADLRKFRRIQLIQPSANQTLKEIEEQKLATETLKTDGNLATRELALSDGGIRSYSDYEVTRAGIILEYDRRKRKRVFSNRSKRGCMTCRKRKKKCDEARPECNNCLQGGFVCEGYLSGP